ncbi:ABC transporter permease [Mesorhizobium sp. KR9-304]|uniref:ABC transporter permease n=1 Tax=Mesorhizobium sp. KR9-304 TaxID=3156614 RepID=UPI0032B4C068
MFGYSIWRSVQTLPVLLGVSFIVFISVYLLPGDVTQQLLGLAASKESIASLRKELGLDDPFIVQFWIWLERVLTGNLGNSHVMRAPVWDLVLGKSMNSFVLMLSSMFIVMVLSFMLATISAWKKDSAIDRAISTAMFLLASMPVFWLGIVLILLFSVTLPLLPSAGMYNLSAPGGFSDLLSHLILPTVTTAATSLAIVTRVTRSAMVDALASPYITAGKARGLSSRSIIYRHAFRNALPTFVNISGLQVGYLFGSAVFSEIIFAWPGIGLQLYNSVISRDGPMIQGCVLMVAVVFVLGNLVADIIVRWLDVHQR